ncbi:MAG: 5-(carboxyamino)imidazole ribonucleotide synthase [Sutterella sp.]|nr:5-(carboxyamino)imidazole ribonucleotide synthase [Sutterella sp.]
MTTQKPLLPGTTLGLMGGGQLGRMFAQSAATLGFHVCVLDPAEHSPAGEVALKQLTGAYTDPELLLTMKELVPAVTTEFENVPAKSLEFFEEAGLTVAPPSSALAVTQDRNLEKAFAQKAGAQVAPHHAILSEADIDAVDESLFPGILKTARLGYDGKGQATVTNREELRTAFHKFGSVDAILEKRVDLALEVSVIAARNRQGEIATFPVSENKHRNGILAVSILPARVDEDIARLARQQAALIASELNYVGVLCVEFFVLKDGTLLVNEMAPRPHNSGHATIDACVTSQYEQQVRTMTGLPLGDTTQHSPAVMLNILGDEWFDETKTFREPAWDKVLAIPGAKLHLYGKTEARLARKMGHVTVVAKTLADALAKARQVAAILKLPESF